MSHLVEIICQTGTKRLHEITHGGSNKNSTHNITTANDTSGCEPPSGNWPQTCYDANVTGYTPAEPALNQTLFCVLDAFCHHEKGATKSSIGYPLDESQLVDVENINGKLVDTTLGHQGQLPTTFTSASFGGYCSPLRIGLHLFHSPTLKMSVQKRVCESGSSLGAGAATLLSGEKTSKPDDGIFSFSDQKLANTSFCKTQWTCDKVGANGVTSTKPINVALTMRESMRPKNQ